MSDEEPRRMSDAEPRERSEDVTETMKLKLIENDLGPVGLRKYPASPVPRRLSRVTLPVRWPVMGEILLPSPMTAEEWDRVMECIAILRPAFVDAVPS